MHSRTHWSRVYSINVDELLTANTEASINNDGSRPSAGLTAIRPLQGRVPLLDFWLTEFAANIPSSAMVRHFQPKYLFKRAFEDFLPQPILTRKTLGLNVPFATWFREGQHDRLAQLLLSDRACDRGLHKSRTVARLIRDYQEGRTNYGNQLFVLANLKHVMYLSKAGRADGA